MALEQFKKYFFTTLVVGITSGLIALTGLDHLAKTSNNFCNQNRDLSIKTNHLKKRSIDSEVNSINQRDSNNDLLKNYSDPGHFFDPINIFNPYSPWNNPEYK